MSNDTLLRSSPDARKDPLAELARMIGDDNLYADLLMQRSRGPESQQPIAATLDDESDIPAMDLRGAAPDVTAPSLNWDELERDLQRFSKAHISEPEAPPQDDFYQPDPPQEPDQWALRDVEEAQQPYDPEPYDQPLADATYQPEPYDQPIDAVAYEPESYDPPVVETTYDPKPLIQDPFDQVHESLDDVRALGSQVTHSPLDELQHLLNEQEAHRQLGTEGYDFERRAAEVLDDERLQAQQSGFAPSTATMGAAGAVAAGAALAAWRTKAPEVRVDQLVRVAAQEAEPHYTADGHMPQHEPHQFPEQSSRQKGGLATIGLVVGLAVAGTAGVFAYRAIKPAPTGEPKLIKAENAPLKVPAAQESTNQAAKAIVDRMEAGKDKIVPREEQPLPAAEQAKQLAPPSIPAGPRVIPLTPQIEAPPIEQQAAPSINDPQIRTVKTVPVQGPGPLPTAPTEVAQTPSQAEPPKVEAPVEPGNAPTAAGLPLPRPADLGEPRKVKVVQVSPDGKIANQTPAVSVTPTPRQAKSDPNAPLAIMPSAQPLRQQQAAVAPVQSEAPPAPSAPAASGGNFVVQITSVKTNEEARSAFTRLQGKYSVLSGYSPNIRAVDLGEKGTYHRVRVGPMSRSNADDVCRQIKASGGDCIVQSN